MSDQASEPSKPDEAGRPVRSAGAAAEPGAAQPEARPAAAVPAEQPGGTEAKKPAGTAAEPRADQTPAAEAEPGGTADSVQGPGQPAGGVVSQAAGPRMASVPNQQALPPMAPLPHQPAAWTPQPVPPMFDDFWPRPEPSAAPAALLAAVLGGAAAAVFVPLGAPGIGWPLLGLVTAAGLLLVGRKAGRKVHIGQIGWAVLALLLLAVCAFRAAEWLTTLCVLTAAVAGTLAVTGARTVLSFALAGIAIPIATLRALPWTVRGTRELRRTRGGLRLAVSVLVSIVLLVVFGALFASADENFAELVATILPTLNAETVFRWTFVFVLFAAGTLGAAFTTARPPELAERTNPVRTLRRLEWALPIGVLVVLFAAFVAVQSTPMFGGEQHVLTTDRLTFSGYARSGFWQLMVVTILTLPIIGAAARWAPKESRLDRNLLRGLAGALAVLTLVIVASALLRMSAYQAAYGYTVLRVLVMTCELWLGVVYLLIIAAGVRLRAAWLPRAVVGTAMAALLALAAINPEGLIAEGNIARYQQTGKLDAFYLSLLSSDAIPALQQLPEPTRQKIVAGIVNELDEKDWRSWNLSDHLAPR
ncbi:hypothetical protein GCM10009545_01690 [Saccharopolyspora thermophila]|uniref:DUF4173 domain-containing protein n=2 Tax=Saccharopolyspora thermophila TaxID=89367 RepID=A0ABN1BQX6_9PSEU